MSFWKKLVENAVGPVAQSAFTFFTRRAELAQARFEAKLKFEQAQGDRMAQLIREGLAADANWEMEFAMQARSSLKDEYALALFSVPMVLCFIKTKNFDGPGIVLAGFESLGKCPWWFLTIVGILFASTVGVRWWRRTQYDTDPTANAGGK